MQTKQRKRLLIISGLVVCLFLVTVTIFSNGLVSHATEMLSQCSDGIDNDGDGMIDSADPNCHTDSNLYNPASYDPTIDTELGEACVQTCPYEPKAGRIIVEFDRANKIKSNGTLTESKTPAVSVEIPAGYYNISMDGIDGYSERASAPAELNEIWKAFLMSDSELIFETVASPDLADGYFCSENKSENIQKNVFVAKNIDSIIAQHAAYPDESSPNDFWPVCLAFDKVNQPPVITLTGVASLDVFVGDVYTDQGATALDFEDGDITSKVITTSTVNTSVVGTYSVYYNATDSQDLMATEKVRTVVVKEKSTGCVSNCGGGGGGGGGGTVLAGPTSLIIFDEKVLSQSNTSALITWKTDASADSIVVYGTSSISNILTNDPHYGYVYTTQTSSTGVLSHSMLVTGLLPGVNYYFRPVSDNPYVNPVVGKELALTSSNQPIVATECNYLLDYLRIDLPNNPIEVSKLQKFLKENENFANVQVNGVFDQATLDAVNIFQTRYFTDILSPWGYGQNQPTGYVYIATRKKINEIYCQQPFPLTQEQLNEIIGVRNALQGLTTTTPLIGKINDNGLMANATTGQEASNIDQEKPLLVGSISEVTNLKGILSRGVYFFVILGVLILILIFIIIKIRRKRNQQPK